MIVNDMLFEYFLKCKTKCYLLAQGYKNSEHKYSESKSFLFRHYKKKYRDKMTNNLNKSDYLVGSAFPKEFKKKFD